jgi:hypothetical protein
MAEASRQATAATAPPLATRRARRKRRGHRKEFFIDITITPTCSFANYLDDIESQNRFIADISSIELGIFRHSHPQKRKGAPPSAPFVFLLSR